ncbi:MAG: diguanylate cyclase [Chloracidobacterium sp.]|nr:diguanylate cyclase [Chloracidobacterium sp.]MDW8217207.1 diguanylate cyclase [Acidobacteriota bacterium]
MSLSRRLGDAPLAVAFFDDERFRLLTSVGYEEYARETLEATLTERLATIQADRLTPVSRSALPSFPFATQDVPTLLIRRFTLDYLLCGALLVEYAQAVNLEQALDGRELGWAFLLRESGWRARLTEAETQLAELGRQLEATRHAVERLTELGEQAIRDREKFIANVDYELRAPLTTVLGYCEMLQDASYGALTDAQREFVRHIEAGGQALLHIVDDLMRLVRLERGGDVLDIREFSVARMFQSLQASFAPIAQRRQVTLEVTLDPACEMLVGDELRLYEAFSQLLDDALRFIPRGGIIRLTGELRRISNNIQNLVVTLQDNTTGIVAEQRLATYRSLTHNGAAGLPLRGVALGLSVTHRILQLHGATLTVEGDTTRGCRLTFQLPHRVAPLPAEAPQVVIVDTEVESSHLLRNILEGEGFKAQLVAASSHDTPATLHASYFEQLTRLPDVVLINAALGPVDGYELCRLIKQTEATRYLPVLMLTASPETTEKLRGLEVGATEVLTKPVNRKELIMRVKALIAQKREFEAMLRAYHSAKHRAITDGLTGLFNHAYFMEKLARKAELAQRTGQALSIIMLDVDRFKHFNDTNGHEAGNELLKDLARLMERCFRRSDLLARYGGEEFVVLLPNTPKSQAAILAERLRRRVAEYPFVGRESQPGGQLTISLGVAAMPSDTDDHKQLLELADRALYRAKQHGRNRVCIVEAEATGRPRPSGFWQVPNPPEAGPPPLPSA